MTTNPHLKQKSPRTFSHTEFPIDSGRPKADSADHPPPAARTKHQMLSSQSRHYRNPPPSKTNSALKNSFPTNRIPSLPSPQLYQKPATQPVHRPRDDPCYIASVVGSQVFERSLRYTIRLSCLQVLCMDMLALSNGWSISHRWLNHVCISSEAFLSLKRVAG